uniref:Fibronectin type-III domain-containing protein n=1 Tax=Ciona savignyi TaxID=51511 RepID=H2YZL4_CIOSA
MLVISWDMVNGTSGYSVEVATTSGEIISASVDVQGNKAYISGLSPFTFYDLSIRAITEGGQLGDHEEFRARTAGSGIRVNAWWMSQTTFGGEATIFREFVIPPGNFYVAVQLTCPVDEVVVWNANMEGTLVAKPVQGTYVIVIDTGAGCPEGITVQNIWEMDQVVNLMDTENPNIMYFIQRVDQWYSNNIGFIFSAACSDRSGLTAVLSKDPSLIAVAFN